jgi:hypothetical protein
MKLVRPFTVTTATLTASNVYEAVPTAYNAGTTYAANAIASVSGANNSHTVYKSLQAGNTGNTPSSSPLWWEAVGTVYGAYSAGTSYSIGNVVTDATNHLLYESLANSNLGNALTDTTKWLQLGPSNRWAMFDQKTGTQTAWLEEINATVAVAGWTDSVVLLNMLNATTVNVTMTVSAVEVHNQNYDLNDLSMVDGWYTWLFEPIQRLTDLALTSLPLSSGASVKVTVTGAVDTTIYVGGLIIGQSRDIGGTQYGANVGITDFSRFEADDFGNYSFTKRSYAKRGEFTVMMPKADTDYVFDLLSTYRATPIVLLGADDYSSTFMFGILRDWSIAITYPSHSILDLDFQGI